MFRQRCNPAGGFGCNNPSEPMKRPMQRVTVTHGVGTATKELEVKIAGTEPTKQRLQNIIELVPDENSIFDVDIEPVDEDANADAHASK